MMIRMGAMNWFSFFLSQNICYGYSKEASQCLGAQGFSGRVLD